MSLGDSNLGSIMHKVHNDVQTFLKKEAQIKKENPEAAKIQFENLIKTLHYSGESIQANITAEGIDDAAKIDHILAAILELENFGAPSKTNQEKQGALQGSFFWDRLKNLKELIARAERKGFKHGERVFKVDTDKQKGEQDDH